MKTYQAGLVRDIITTDPSGTSSVHRTKTTIIRIETTDDFNPDHGPNGYDLLGEWRIVSVVRELDEAHP